MTSMITGNGICTTASVAETPRLQRGDVVSRVRHLPD